jgi:hypothetical protein
MTPNIIHTMKHTVKASVLTISTDHAWRGMGVGRAVGLVREAMMLTRPGLARLSARPMSVTIRPVARRGTAEERWGHAGT